MTTKSTGSGNKPNFKLQKDSNGINGWNLQKKTHTNVEQYANTTFTEKYKTEADTKLAEAQGTFVDTTDPVTNLVSNKLVKVTYQGNPVYIVASGDSLSSLKFTNEEGQEFTLADFFTEDSSKTYWVGASDVTVAESDPGSGRQIKLYKAKDASTALAVKQANYKDESAFNKDLAKVVEGEAGTIAEHNGGYYVATENQGTAWSEPKWKDSTSVNKFFTMPSSTSHQIVAPGKADDADAIKWANAAYDAAIDKLTGAAAATGTIEYTVSNKSVLEDVAGEETFEEIGNSRPRATLAPLPLPLR